MDIHAQIAAMGKAARSASRCMAAADTACKTRALDAIAARIEARRTQLLAANAKDLQRAEKNALAAPLLARLQLDRDVIARMLDGLRKIALLPDPTGEITELRRQSSGIEVGRMRVPLGVIGVIYESRPNVTVDAAALCLMAGNAVILRGGSEALETNRQIAACITAGLETAGLPKTAVQLVDTTDRAAVGAMITMPEYIDVIIPRGGRSLVERLDREARIPVIKHLDGVCHVYVDGTADSEKALAIAVNSKTEKLAVCNAMETLLVAMDMAPRLLPPLCARMQQHGIRLKGCARTRAFVPHADMEAATEEDWRAEYLGPVLAVRVVADLDEAITHINTYGSMHTDSIVSEDYGNVRRFMREVDSASVMANVSTQFADGFEFGLGAEIGISTNRLHARGPVGLEGLTTRKFVVFGNGEIRHRSGDREE